MWCSMVIFTCSSKNYFNKHEETGITQSAGLVIEWSRVRVPAGEAGECSFPGSTIRVDSYFGIRSTPVLPQYHVKDPGHSAKGADGRL